MLNTLLPTGIKNFLNFANQCFLKQLLHELKAVQRLDIVWDQYFDQSIKSGTRLARWSGTRRKVAPKTRHPTERCYSWKKFLRNNQNKQELMKYFNEVAVASASTLFGTKWVNLTDKSNVIPLGKAQPMDSCDIEEADSRIIVHMVDAALHGFQRICVRTVDSDIVYIIIGQLCKLLEINEQLQVSVAFGTGKHCRFLDINAMAVSLSDKLCRALPVFHAFTGCDTVSFF